MVALPFDTAVTTPYSSTVTFFSLSLVHFTWRMVALSGETVASSIRDSPT